jgi:hypothetical protein
MADGEGTAGTVISDVAPALGAVPYVGPILSAAASIGGGLLQSDAAKKQAAQAAQVRQNALNTQVQPMRPEYLAALHLAQMRSLGGLPGLQTDKTDLAQQLADQIRYIRMASPGGNQALAAMSKAVAANSTGLQKLQAQDLNYRGLADKDVADTLWKVGDAGRNLENIRDTQRTQGLTAAAALENASMVNKQQGASTALGAVSTGANQLLNNYMKLYQNQNSGSSANNIANNGMSSTGDVSLDARNNLNGYSGFSPAQLTHNYLATTSPNTPMTSDAIFSAAMNSSNNTAGSVGYTPPSLTGATNIAAPAATDSNQFLTPTGEGF